jgi:hypothetical protein
MFLRYSQWDDAIETALISSILPQWIHVAPSIPISKNIFVSHWEVMNAYHKSGRVFLSRLSCRKAPGSWMCKISKHTHTQLSPTGSIQSHKMMVCTFHDLGGAKNFEEIIFESTKWWLEKKFHIEIHRPKSAHFGRQFLYEFGIVGSPSSW